ncbi:Na-translocating system protein MpsC family protein [Planococcus lenghuensis]|uniref:Na-translocating system protein MpsC family protein n=1 Tax=Planococcus lenghuensis TaxID=2213202 RepID=UPI0038CDB77C
MRYRKKLFKKNLAAIFSNLLRTYFRKGPNAIYFTMERPFITIHLRGFLAAMEKTL